jgi:hypothetical protein
MSGNQTKLLDTFTDMLNQSLRGLTPQERTQQNLFNYAFGYLFAFGRRTVTNAIFAMGRQFHDWSSTYRLFSRVPWDPDDLFDKELREALKYLKKGDPIVFALDDVHVGKTGKKIRDVRLVRDPQSPKFRVNLIYALRFIQLTLLLRPLEERGACWSIPSRFRIAPIVKKPKRNASPEEIAEYKQLSKEKSLAIQAAQIVTALHERLRQMPDYANREVYFVVDASYMNKAFLKHIPRDVHVIGRTRKNARLRAPFNGEGKKRGRRRKYGPALPTPEEIFKTKWAPAQKCKVYYAGRKRTMKYQEVGPVFWPGGAGDRPLRLIILSPIPYRRTKKSKLSYRKQAYLLTTDLSTPVVKLIQQYLDRLQIELNHRDEKDILGIGEMQVRSSLSVERAAAFAVALYSHLLLSALRAYGPGWSRDHYAPLPKWWSRAPERPSLQNILNRLRAEYLMKANLLDRDEKTGLFHFSRNGRAPVTGKIPLIDPASALIYAKT